MPGLLVFRPADANEVAETWRVIMPLRHEPACPRALPAGGAHLRPHAGWRPPPGSPRAPTCWPTPPAGDPDVILIATGSEVALALAACDELTAGGHRRPGGEHAVLGTVRPAATPVPRPGAPAAVTARVAVEQASTLGWHRYVGDAGAVVGMHTFGASAPLKQL